MTKTRIEQHIDARPAAVYEAFLNADSIAQWMVPDGMTSEVHEFDSHEGGKFRVSLTYDDPSAAGKTSAHTDTYRGRFVSLEKNQRIVALTGERDDARTERDRLRAIVDAAREMVAERRAVLASLRLSSGGVDRDAFRAASTADQRMLALLAQLDVSGEAAGG